MQDCHQIFLQSSLSHGPAWKLLEEPVLPPWGQEPLYVTVPFAPSLVPHDPLLWDHPGIKALPGWAEVSKIATNLNIKARITNICHLREQLEALDQVLHAWNVAESLKQCRP